MNYVIIGSALEGNKGAASMLEASIQSLSAQDKKAKFTLLSLYPKEDKQLNNYKSLTVLATKPMTLAFIVNPLCLLYRILPPARGLLSKNAHVRAIRDSDSYLDQAGITFVDGREKFLIYNIAILMPAILMKKKIIKCSQALGPFNSKINEVSAKYFLPKVSKILARGKITLSYLQQLKLNNVSEAADYAFSLKVTDQEAKQAVTILNKYGYKKTERNIGILPSMVMKNKLTKDGKSYTQIMAKLIDKLTQDGFKVYLIPHSQRLAADKTHNNDMPVCNDIYQQLSDKDGCILVTDNLNAQQLRKVISLMNLNICGRFHAMVSSLSVEVPVLVTGWNHKYEEVLSSFGIPECAIDQKSISTPALYKKFNTLFANRQKLQGRISKNIDKVRKSSQMNTEYILEASNG